MKNKNLNIILAESIHEEIINDMHIKKRVIKNYLIEDLSNLSMYELLQVQDFVTNIQMDRK